MKLFPILLIAVLCVACVQRRDAVNRKEREPEATSAVSVATLAQDSTIDRYSMVTYYIAFMRKGPKWTDTPTPEVMAIQDAHMSYIEKLAAESALVLAGPFVGQSGENALAGMFLFRVATVEEARRLTDADPAVLSGRFTMEIVPWLGPSTLRY